MTLDRALTWYVEGDGAYRLEVAVSDERADGVHRRKSIGYLIRGLRGSAHFFSLSGEQARFDSVPAFMAELSKIYADSVL